MALAKRIIPCLDCDLSVPRGRVVKGVKFKQIRYAGEPRELAASYFKQGADEIVFLDITASSERRDTMTHVIEETAEEVFIPLTVGGGISSVEDMRQVLSVGADKITVNTAALKNPSVVEEGAEVFGSQCIVVAIDAKHISEDAWECFIYGGRKNTKINAVEWAKQVEDLGAGEIMLTSMDRDGTKKGFDLDLTRKISEAVNIPVIASGGVGNPKHMLEAFTKAKADAALAASIFHFNEFPVQQVKDYLRKQGVNVR